MSADTLTVDGFGRRIDGSYSCNLTALLVDVSSPDALLVSEAETIARLSGARGFEIAERFLAGDWVVRMAVGLVVLGRHDIQVGEQQGWKARVGAFRFEMEPATDDQDDEDDAGDPPAEEGTPSESGGESGSQTSEPDPATDLPATGRLASVG